MSFLGDIQTIAGASGLRGNVLTEFQPCSPQIQMRGQAFEGKHL
jgi:hypothetical protein